MGLVEELKEELIEELKELRDGAPPPANDGAWKIWFTASPVVRDATALLAARMLLAAFMDSVWLGFVVGYSKDYGFKYWFIYLTNWTLTVQCTYLTLSVYGTWVTQRRTLSDAQPWWVGACMRLHGVCMPGSFLVFVLFWFLVFPYWPEAATYPIVYLVHGANFAVMIADGVLLPMPFRVRNALLMEAYGVLYISFSIVYYWAGGTNEWHQPWIYLPIYWGGDVGAAVRLCLLLLLILVPLILLFAWIAGRMRDRWAAASRLGQSSNWDYPDSVDRTGLGGRDRDGRLGQALLAPDGSGSLDDILDDAEEASASGDASAEPHAAGVPPALGPPRGPLAGGMPPRLRHVRSRSRGGSGGSSERELLIIESGGQADPLVPMSARAGAAGAGGGVFSSAAAALDAAS